MSESLAASLLAYLSDRQDAMVALVNQFARSESPSLDPSAQQEILTLLTEAMVARGFRARRTRGRTSGGSLLSMPADRTRGRPFQVMLGHCDTVWPIGTLETMRLEIKDGRLHGPGTFDMKAGIVQGLFAIDALREVGQALSVTPVFFINSDEEIGSRDSTHQIRLIARGAERVFVLEPAMGARGALKTARKGLGRFTITVRGQAAHAGLEPGKGASAILELSLVIQQLFALNDIDGGVSVNVGTIDGGIRPNVVAPESTAVADVRVPTFKDAERVSAAIHGLTPQTPGTTIEVDGSFGRPPMERTPGNQALFEEAKAAARALDIEIEEASAGGGSDGNTTSLFAPTLDGLGAVGEGAHAPHEHLLVDRMVERSALLACLLARPPRDVQSGDSP